MLVSPSPSHGILWTPPPPHPPIHTPTHYAPSRLLTQTGAPQRLKVVFALLIYPKVGFACVGYISISRGTIQRGPLFPVPYHLANTSLWHESHPILLLTGMYGAGDASPPYPPKMPLHFQLLPLSSCECSARDTLIFSLKAGREEIMQV